MSYFIIGDVHGCFYTYKYFIDKYWDPRKEILIQVGDIAYKGKNTYETLAYSLDLAKKYPKNFIQLKGNNDHIFLQKIIEKGVPKILEKILEDYDLTTVELLSWLKHLPHSYETDTFFVSHAGIDKKTIYPVPINDMSIVNTREKLRNIGKTQFIGHIGVTVPTYDKGSNVWYLDTGAGFGEKLSGIKVKSTGKVCDIISTIIKSKDIN